MPPLPVSVFYGGFGIPELELNDLINRLVAAEDPEEVRRLYRQWADSYDRDLDEFGYVAPVIGVTLFQQWVSEKDVIIHDAGCGTGQVGKLLAVAGYSNVHGSDFSEEMLGVAKSAECYRSLQQADYTQTLNFNSGSVDAIISIGVYTKRFKNNFLPEMLRILKPDGCMVFSCRPVYFDEVADSLKAMHEEMKLSKSFISYDDYMIGQNASAYYIALQKAVADE